MELLPSEEEPDEEEYSTNSDEGFPNIQRVSTYPARLTEDGGVERIGPVEIISEVDPEWNQWRTSGLRIALTQITKREHVHTQQLLCRYPHQQRIAGSGEDHAV